MKEKLTNILINNNIIPKENIPIYFYGLNVALLLLYNFIFGLVISIILKSTVSFIIILALFMPLRRYSGGFHASKQIYCFIYSQLILLIGELLSTFTSTIFLNIIGICSILALIIVIIKSPVASKYKPINESQYLKYRKNTISLCVSYIVLYVISYAIAKNSCICTSISYILIIQAILLVIPEQKHTVSK